MSKKNDLVIGFKVYPGPRPIHFMVYVWPTKRLMNERLKPITKISRKLVGLCISNSRHMVRVRGMMKLSPCIGQIHLFRSGLTMATITHESGHAAFGYARRMKFNPLQVVSNRFASDGEERYCKALDEVARQIVVETNKLCLGKRRGA